MLRASCRAIGAAVLLAAAFAAEPAVAQDFPSRPVRIVIGFGPGSVADVAARVLGHRMGQTLGQQVVVENRAGAGSNLGAEYVTRAAKDGHTLFMATIANTINPALASLPFDFARDLAPVSLIATSPQVLVVHPSLGVNSVQELIAMAKDKPGEIHYASSGVGALSNLSGLLMNGMAGIRLVPVPYPGSAQGVNDVLAGRVPMMFASAATVWPHVASGALKALATTQLARLPMAPDLLTMAEAGLQGYDAVVWMGLLAPTGTPRDVIDKLAQAANEALKSEEVLTPLRAQGFGPIGSTPDEFGRYIAGELAKWDNVAAAAGLKTRPK